MLDPRDGAVVAMASYPDFNPADFTDGIDDVEWAALNAEASHYPLINRAIQGQYAPGSTFKLVTAYAGLTTGFITPQTTWADAGTYRVPNCRGDSCIFRNAGSRSYGRVELRRALTVSSRHVLLRHRRPRSGSAATSIPTPSRTPPSCSAWAPTAACRCRTRRAAGS